MNFAYQFFEALTIVSLDWREGHLDNLMNDSWEVGAFKCPLKAGHLVEDTAKSPDVTLIIVRFTFTLYVKKKICISFTYMLCNGYGLRLDLYAYNFR